MCKRILVLLLIGVTVYAQDQAAIGPTKRPLPNATLQTRHVALRRGRTDKVHLLTNVQGLVTLPSRSVPGIVPLRVELRSSDGLTFEPIVYPRPQNMKFGFSSDPIPVWRGPMLKTKVHVAATATLGLHTITGRLVYQTVDQLGVNELREVPVTANVTVVERNAHVAVDKDWGEMSTGEIIVIVLLSPILVPLALICVVAFGGCGY